MNIANHDAITLGFSLLYEVIGTEIWARLPKYCDYARLRRDARYYSTNPHGWHGFGSVRNIRFSQQSYLDHIRIMFKPDKNSEIVLRFDLYYSNVTQNNLF